MRAMVDINVLVDVLQRREPFFLASAHVCDMAASGGLVGFISAHAITTIYYITRKFADADSAGKALDWLLGTFDVAGVSKAVIQRARGLSMADFEDAVVAAASESARCDYIITRNIMDFDKSPVPAIAPSEFLALAK